MQIHIFINRLRKYLDRDLFRSLNISTDIYYTLNKFVHFYIFVFRHVILQRQRRQRLKQIS